jgi:5-histidylcysteine sulfoxide synthase
MSTSQTRNPNLDFDHIAVPHALPQLGQTSGHSLLFPRDASWWTGPSPDALHCAGRDLDGCIHALPIPNLRTCTRSEVQAYFDNGWVLTELLFACLIHEEGFYRPPYHNLRHPLIFYYTHPAVLYINKLHVAGLLPRTLHPYYERLFETGVDEMSWDDLSKNEMDWPALSECQAYRRQCYEQVSAVIASHPDLADGHPPISMESPLWALFLGFEHERIHLETSSVLIRELPVSLVKRHPGFPHLHPSARPLTMDEPWRSPQAGHEYPFNPWTAVAPGTAVIGKDPHFPSYGWDNEYGRRSVEVPAFGVTRQLISNGEFLEFVRAGGYRDEVWWTEEGWQWRAYRNIKWPSFWVPIGAQGSHEYALRTCFEIVSMPWDWPAHVNFHEAKAYAAWRTTQEKRAYPLRLLTEAEHHRLRRHIATGTKPQDITVAWAFLDDERYNLALRHGSEGPVEGHADDTVTDVFGNVWQWLEDHFHPLPGFAVHTYYDDFSTPCFDGKHQMIMGGSFISAGDEATLHARFHFRPHFYQHAGFRLVDPLRNDNHGVVQLIANHEADHKGEEDLRRAELFRNFAAPEDLILGTGGVEDLDRVVLTKILIQHLPASMLQGGRALDIGCGTGGLSYALAQLGLQTLGCDLSRSVIDLAKSWQKEAQLTLVHPDNPLQILPIKLDPAVCARLDWRQCDASSLPADWIDFDCIVIKQLLSLLPSPKSLLGRMSGPRALLKPGGFLLLADRYAWKPQLTPEPLWLDPQPEAMAKVLGKDFELKAAGQCLEINRPERDKLVMERLHVTLWRRLS